MIIIWVLIALPLVQIWPTTVMTLSHLVPHWLHNKTQCKERVKMRGSERISSKNRERRRRQRRSGRSSSWNASRWRIINASLSLSLFIMLSSSLSLFFSLSLYMVQLRLWVLVHPHPFIYGTSAYTGVGCVHTHLNRCKHLLDYSAVHSNLSCLLHF